MLKRFAYTIGFATVCVAAGFFLATGWNAPAPGVAQPTGNTPATTASLPDYPINEQGESPFVAVAEEVKPVVVNIAADKELTGHPGIPFELFDWGPFFGQPPEGGHGQHVPHITSGGSGIIVDAEGFILTNNHMVSESGDITVKLSDGTTLKAKVIGADPETDVALIKVDHKFTPEMVARLGDSDKIRIGEWAIAVGNPFGLDWTVTVGVISARGRSNLRIGGEQGPSYQDFIQTDASINFGNSGGPLVNIHGEVIGINTAINAQGQGIGFAIPINLARDIMLQLKTSGEVKRGYLGIYTGELTDIKKEALGLDAGLTGVLVEGAQEKTPAAEGGLKGGEVITEINGLPVKDVSDFRFRIASYKPGSDVELTLLIDSKEKRIKFKLADRSDFVPVAGAAPEPSEGWLGLEVAPTKSRMGAQMGVDDMEGALVVRIDPDSPAAGLIEPGDVIVEIAGDEIGSVVDFNNAAEKLKDRKKAIPFWVIRDGRRTFIPVRPE
jgi:serine protease Do